MRLIHRQFRNRPTPLADAPRGASARDICESRPEATSLPRRPEEDALPLFFSHFPQNFSEIRSEKSLQIRRRNRSTLPTKFRSMQLSSRHAKSRHAPRNAEERSPDGGRKRGKASRFSFLDEKRRSFNL